MGLRKVSDSNGVVTLSLRNEEVQQLEDTAVRQAMETITNRIDELAVKETSITARGETIVVEVPGQDQAYFQQIRDIIRRTGAGHVIAPGDVEAMIAVIDGTAGQPSRDERAVRYFSAAEAGGRLAAIFDGVMAKGAAG